MKNEAGAKSTPTQMGRSRLRAVTATAGVVVMTTNWTLLHHLTQMRDTLAFDARHCKNDLDELAVLQREHRWYEHRIERFWQQQARYDGSGAIPARYRHAREGVERRRAL